jgi:N-acetyl-anhydromuramyl-L-alanine amidase AmpD
MAGNLTVESCGNIFAPTSRQASSNYGVGTDGRIALYVDEANRSWCTSSTANDNRAVTIEVANDGGAPDWHVSDKALAALIDLCTDICKRNGIPKLLWKADKSLIGNVAQQNMTVHRWFAAKACPGDYLYNLHGHIAAEVNKRLRSGGAPAPTAPAKPAAIRATIRQGSANKDAVRYLQARLNTLQGARLTIDGIFGPATDRAVRAFQTMCKLTPDGIVGPLTWGKLG